MGLVAQTIYIKFRKSNCQPNFVGIDWWRMEACESQSLNDGRRIRHPRVQWVR